MQDPITTTPFAAGEKTIPRDRSPVAATPAVPLLTWAAFAVALVALAGSLGLSLALGLKPCPLCYYQRTFVMGVVGVLGLGLLAEARLRGVLSLLALPLAVAGLGVAAFHEYLEATGKLECPPGFFDLGTAPQQSLAALAVLVIVLGVDALLGGMGSITALLVRIVGGALLGFILAVASIISVPPPTLPTTPYKAAPDICRPPFRSPQ